MAGPGARPPRNVAATRGGGTSLLRHGGCWRAACPGERARADVAALPGAAAGTCSGDAPSSRGRPPLLTGAAGSFEEPRQAARVPAKAKAPRGFPRGFHTSRRRPTLPDRYQPSTIGPEELSFRVRNGNGRFLLGMATGKTAKLSQLERAFLGLRTQENGYLCGQAARPISTGQLHASPRFHLPPINLVIYQGPSGAYTRDTLS